MTAYTVFLPCAAGVEDYLAAEVRRIAGAAVVPQARRGGVAAEVPWSGVLGLNLHSRLAQRVLLQLVHTPYRGEQDLYEAARSVDWAQWFTPRQTFKVEVTAQHSPLRSLNFAALKIKDAVCDRFRADCGERPSVDTRQPDVRLYAHLTREQLTLYIDTSGEPLFKRGWRVDKGDAPLKETLAAALLAASGWTEGWDGEAAHLPPLYDPCCGSGTIVIEAAQIACHHAPGLLRRFAFERLRPHQPQLWQTLRAQAQAAVRLPAEPVVYGSDVAHRMVDFARRNAERAGVAAAVQLRGGDALQRLPPVQRPGLIVMNPPYGERIGVGGSARARETAQTDGEGAFFERLAAHWKKHYAGWTAWVLTPDLRLPARLRLKGSRRVPLWNGPIECRLFRFDLMHGPVRAEQAA
ncbi:MAG: class I SAM-dependent RNA methyltransferase [Hylemonella sp.]